MQEVSQQRRIWWGCQALSRQPATQRVAFFNAPLLESLNTSSLLVFTPCSQSPRRSMTAKNKKHYSLVLFVHFLPFSFFSFCSHSLFSQTGIGQSTINLFLKQAEAQWILAGLKGVLPSLGLFSFPFFLFFFFLAREKGCKLTCRGVRLCWLQETDALQEFWKQTRLTLFSRLWLLFSPLFWRCKQAPFKSSCIFIIISRELPGIPPIGKHVILSKAKVRIVWGEKCYFNYSKFSSTIPCKHAL